MTDREVEALFTTIEADAKKACPDDHSGQLSYQIGMYRAQVFYLECTLRAKNRRIQHLERSIEEECLGGVQ